MDTLFRLVSLQPSDHQQQSNSSFNSSRTSTTSSKSLKQNHHHRRHTNYNYHFQNYSSQEEVDQEEECFNTTTTNQLYMDEDFSSSSSNPNPVPCIPNPTFSIPENPNLPDLLLECSRAFSTHDTPRIQHLMWMINELSSPYGDPDQKLASYFLQAFFARLSNSGPLTLQTLSSASEKTMSFDSTRRIALKFQELSPWSSFGHVASNGAILEAFLDQSSASSNRPLHIIDVSNTFCTQWPTLLEALATRSTEDTPHLTITTVVSSPQRVMKEIAARMEKFARLMGVPFKFNMVRHPGDPSTLDLDRLDVVPGATLAINLVNTLHTVSPAGGSRDVFVSALRRLQPRIVTVVEEHADLLESGEELKWFGESLRFYTAYFDSLEESFGKTSNERLALERQAGRGMVDLVACPAAESKERRETGSGWARRMGAVGFVPAGFSDDVADDVRALLRRYREGWAMRGAEAGNEGGVFLEWKEQPVVWASSWRL